ncbi:MAG TPA: MBL fold metallo-hydrolase [Ignavibacteria bacterium]|jgi:phosphoribosyl 1,2-cyclic phosphate phosphodiesterase
MKVIILGSGTSQGIPIVGCKCPACISINPKDKRLRVSVYLETDSPSPSGRERLPAEASEQAGEGAHGKPLKLLIDTSTDFRQQMLNNSVTDIDAVLYTHYHADHIMGLDDIRQINQLHKKTIDLYGNKETIENIRRSFAYIFDPNTYRGGGIPDVKTKIITADKFYVGNIEITPVKYLHGPTTVFGFRIGDFAYMPDCSKIPEKEFEKLHGLKVLILDALRYRKHETHFSIGEAVEAAKRINAVQTYFTHMTHDVVHDEANAKLPPGIELAYDGLKIEL